MGNEHHLRFSGRRALVTGASRGIGAAIARQLAEEGAHVTLVARNFESDCQPPPDVPSHRWSLLTVDLAEPGACQRAVAAASGDGGLDILVNNAGQFLGGGWLEGELSKARDLFEIDFWVPIMLVRKAQTALSKAKGCVINISSLNGTRPSPSAGAYSTAKAALDMATRCLALEFAPQGVRVNCIAPGPVPTALLKDALGEQDSSWLPDCIPLSRLGTESDIAASVSWLASDEASWITGQVLGVDGGMSV